MFGYVQMAFVWGETMENPRERGLKAFVPLCSHHGSLATLRLLGSTMQHERVTPHGPHEDKCASSVPCDAGLLDWRFSLSSDPSVVE